MMNREDYIFCKNYSDCVMGNANKDMDHDRFNKLKDIYIKLTPKDKKQIMKSIFKCKFKGDAGRKM